MYKEKTVHLKKYTFSYDVFVVELFQTLRRRVSDDVFVRFPVSYTHLTLPTTPYV